MDVDLSYGGLHEECGVFAAFGIEGAARAAFFALLDLQHRGQQGCGIAVAGDDGIIRLHKGPGLVRQVFPQEALATLSGRCAIGHVRYPTTNVGGRENIQPFYMKDGKGGFAVAHNGNLVNAEQIKGLLQGEGHLLTSTSDSELIGQLIGRDRHAESREAGIRAAARLLDGAFCAVVLTPDAVWAFRDKFGFHPLALGRLGNGYVVASETCAFRVIGAEYLRDIEPGEILRIDRDGLHSDRFAQAAPPRTCAMESIYFARPDSVIGGQSVYAFRKKSGALLYREHPVAADLVTAVPESGYPAAIGYAQASGIPYEMGLLKNMYVARTFIQPAQHMREVGVRMKLSPMEGVIGGKRILIIDDSIVRGTTSRKIVSLLRDAGAAEVHMAIASPPYAFPCYYGIDTGTRDQLIAARLSVEEIRCYIGADSLHYLSRGALSEAARGAGLCAACFDGDYPTDLYGHDEETNKIS